MVGVGYVGLVTGTCLAESGNEVLCVDNDTRKIALLKKGKVPIYEPGLEMLIARNVKEKRLIFTTDLARGVKDALIIFIAVGTPPADDGASDLSQIFAVAREIGRTMKTYKIVVTKSTVPVGTAEKVNSIIAQVTKHSFDMVSNPEFLKEGAAIEDFMKPDRIILGVEKPEVEEAMKELYAPFVRT